MKNEPFLSVITVWTQKPLCDSQESCWLSQNLKFIVVFLMARHWATVQRC